MQVCCRCHKAARKDLARGVRKSPRRALQAVMQDVDMCTKLKEFAGTRLKLMLELPRSGRGSVSIVREAIASAIGGRAFWMYTSWADAEHPTTSMAHSE